MTIIVLCELCANATHWSGKRYQSLTVVHVNQGEYEAVLSYNRFLCFLTACSTCFLCSQWNIDVFVC